ncbi:DNA repair and recombination protein RadA, partial [candidate division MSBL1 archaeon SCGC-AAA261C02]
IIEVFGEFGSGKTQLGHQLSVNVQLPKDKGGLEGKTIYIDSENTFRPERINQIAKSLDLDPDQVLDDIYVARACTTDHQMLLAEEAFEMAKEEDIRLLVIDGLMSLFRTEYVGRGALAQRQQKLGKHLATIQKVAERCNLAAFVTNHVQSKPDVFFGDPTRPIGGHVLGHAATGRVYIRKSKKNTRQAQLIDHPNLPPKKVKFQISDKGIRD